MKFCLPGCLTCIGPIDVIINKLVDSGVGCHIFDSYVGCIVFSCLLLSFT